MYNKEQIHNALTIEELIAHGKEVQSDYNEPSYNIDGNDIYVVIGDNNNVNSFNGTNRPSGAGHVSYDYDTSDMTACEMCTVGMSYENCSQCVHWEDSLIHQEERRIIAHEKSVERRNALLLALWTTAKWTVFLPFTLLSREAKIRAEMNNGTSMIEDKTEYIDVDVVEDTTPQLSHREIENQKALYSSARDRAELNAKSNQNTVSVYDFVNQ